MPPEQTPGPDLAVLLPSWELFLRDEWESPVAADHRVRELHVIPGRLLIRGGGHLGLATGARSNRAALGGGACVPSDRDSGKISVWCTDPGYRPGSGPDVGSAGAATVDSRGVLGLVALRNAADVDACRWGSAVGGCALELQDHDRVVADDPSIVPGLEHVGVTDADIGLAAIGVDDVQPAGLDRPHVPQLAGGCRR